MAIVIIAILIGGGIFFYTSTKSPHQDKITLDEQFTTENILDSCPEVDTKKQDWKSSAIMIDPASANLQDIANTLLLRGNNYLLPPDSPVKNQRIQTILQEKPIMIIGLEIDPSTDTMRAIILQNSVKSKKLSCLIMNQLANNQEIYPIIPNTVTIEIDPLSYPATSQEVILRTKQPSLILEMGTLTANHSTENTFEIAKSIHKAIEVYYE
jgi:hypothetical protein